MRSLFAAALAAALLAGCAGSPPPAAAVLPPADFAIGTAFDAVTRDRLDRAFLDALKRTRSERMSAAVATIRGLWMSTPASGEAPAPYWASVGKAVTAAVVLRLEAEGKLSLDDPVSRWMPELPHAGVMTVDHLLRHTAGLFSFNEDEELRARPRYCSPEESLAIALRHPPLFLPGRGWRYSNTGYVVLGRIIEAVERRPYHEVVNARFGSGTLRAAAPGGEAEPGMNPGWGYAAGSVVGSAGDMLRFWHGLLTADRETAARLFERLHPMFDPGTWYGRGVMLYAFEDRVLGPTTWLGHSGGTPGVKAVVAYAPARQAFVAVALRGDGSAEASANLLLAALD